MRSRPTSKPTHARAVDSTILADAVATQDTITQLISAIRRVGRTVPGTAVPDKSRRDAIQNCRELRLPTIRVYASQ